MKLSDLPTEILVQITLELASPRRNLYGFVLTCRRFKGIGDPIFWQCAALELDSYPYPFITAVLANKALAGHLRELRLHEGWLCNHEYYGDTNHSTEHHGLPLAICQKITQILQMFQGLCTLVHDDLHDTLTTHPCLVEAVCQHRNITQLSLGPIFLQSAVDYSTLVNIRAPIASFRLENYALPFHIFQIIEKFRNTLRILHLSEGMLPHCERSIPPFSICSHTFSGKHDSTSFAYRTHGLSRRNASRGV